MLNKLLNLLSGNKESGASSLTDFSLMAVDLHSHLIPGIDDGVKTLDESLAMLRQFAAWGFKKVITTPHLMAGGFNNTPEIINSGKQQVLEAIKQQNIPIEFDAAAEYYLDETFYEKTEKKEFLTIGKSYVLVEFSMHAKPFNVADIVYKMQTAGYHIILAHPERYPYYYEPDFEGYNGLKDRGIYFQVNLMSLSGRYGKHAKYTAEKMIDENMVDFMGSDLHGVRHTEAIHACLKEKYLEKILTSGKLLNKTLL